MATRKLLPSERAPVLQLPENLKKIFSVEFPGHVQNIDKVKQVLGGDNAIMNAYLGGAPLDVRYRLKDPFAIPVHGTTIPTSNLLLKVTRRYKVKRQPGTVRSQEIRAPRDDDELYDENEQPETQYEMAGVISKTTRFSGLADFQTLVDPKDEIYKVKSDLLNMDYESLIALKIDHRNPVEDIATLQVLPPPSLSKTNLANPYRYRAREGTIGEVQEERTGHGRGRGLGRGHRPGRRGPNARGNGRGKNYRKPTNMAAILKADTVATFTAAANAAMQE
ncbi:tau 95 subunit of transcription factor TFIIIC [Gryganskiella cystojenkinii]|nr:tau 95 subunit of transcription factor TFIIIC [Gryganskiella cystojenkinii]